jgi:TonB-linked SusC/RagA family outer membrane protein
MEKRSLIAGVFTTLKKPLLIMKLTLMMALFCTLQATAGLNAQNVTIKVTDTEIGKVLNSIEKQGVYRFLFNSRLRDLKQKVSADFTDADINLVLQRIFNGTSLSYLKLENNLVAIRSNNPAEADITVSGKVTGDGGDPIAAASVSVKGSSKGTVTDFNGNFSISVPENATLVISAIGYNTMEVKVNNQQTISVKLELATRKMDEVVVIGYGAASKRDLTGSIVKISGKDIADKPNPNPIASLQSRVPGLYIVNNGTPGQAPDIRIRGTISIGSVSPLYVVDGIFNDNIDFINPNDIESIEVLKDPSSLAIFGVRGAAGVILITTKKAKAGQLNINFNSTYGFKTLVDKIDMADAAQFRELFEEEKANLNTPIPAFDYTPWTGNTDWIDAVTRTGKFTNTSLSVAGSTEKNKFNLGLGFIQDEGIIRHERLQKILFSFADEFKFNKNIKVGINFNGSRQNLPIPWASGILDQARKVVPIVPSGYRTVFTKNPYGLDSMNQNLYYELPGFQNSGVVNPLLQLENEWDKTISNEYRMVGSVYAEINFLRNFTFRSTGYLDMSTVNTRRYLPLYNSYDVVTNKVFAYSPQTRVSEDDNTFRKTQQDHILTYKRKFADHSVNVNAGFTTYYFGFAGRSASVNQSATGAAIPDDKRFWYISNGFGDPASQRSSSGQSERTTVSGLLRVLYNYAGKYYVNASYRRDASSQISPSDRTQDFWAVGAAWEMTREKFMENQKIFDYIKVKASMGVLGNQNTTRDYPFYPTLTGGRAAVFGNNIYTAFQPRYIPDPNLRWEIVRGKEAGVELSMLKGRLNFEANYYNKLTEDLLTEIPGISGTLPRLTNAGKIRNSGIELSATWNHRFSKDFSLTISGNLTTFNNRVVELAEKDYVLITAFNRTEVGQPIGAFYGYIVEGIYQSYADKLGSPVNTEFSYGPGDFKYRDVNGDGVINTKDRTFIGNPTPDFIYGGTVGVNYKGFDASVDIGGVYGNEVYRTWGGTESPFQRVNYPAFKIGRWNGPGTSNWHPILGQDHRINYEASTYGIEDGSYIRIRNAQIGYNFSSALLAKTKVVKSLRLFANAQNLVTFKRNSGYTPEFGGSAIEFGVDRAGGAIPRVITFGINANF